MIIDFHTHIFSPRIKNNREKYTRDDPLFKLLYSPPQVKLATAEDLISSMDEGDIDISVVQNIAWSSPEMCRETNDYILESIARYPGRLIGFGMVALDSPNSALEEIGRCVSGGIKGIGEIRPGREILHNLNLIRPIIRELINRDLVLLTHASEPLGHIYPGKGDITPGVLYPFIAAFPELKVVCAHWGGGIPFYSLMPEVKKALENAYFDSAASPFLYEPLVYPQVAQLAGAGKILFGSDYPLLPPRRLLKEVESLDLADGIKNQILFENAQKLLGIKRQ
jgi:uncharacterized protein